MTTSTWNGANANWGFNNWGFFGVPNGSTNNAVINNGNVSLNINASLNALTVSGTGILSLNQPNFTLNVNGSNGTTTFSGGNINISAAATLGSTNFNMSGGTFAESAGNLNVTSQLNISGGTFNQSGGAVTVGAAAFTGGTDTIGSTFSATTLNVGTNNGASQTLTIGSGGKVTVSGLTTVQNSNSASTSSKIALSGGSLTITGGLIFGAGTANQGSVSGFGAVNGAGSINGNGSINASGGTLTVASTINNSVKLVIDGTKASDLLINGTATAGSAVTINSSNQTLEIGTVGNLTITPAENITNGAIKLDGGKLTDSTGINVTSANLSGLGTVGGLLTGNGIVLATGGKLDLTSNLSSTTLSFETANSAASVLQLDGTTAGGNKFTFLGNAGEVAFNNSATVTENIAGLNVGSSATIATNFVDLLGNFTISGSNAHTGSSGTITLLNGGVTDTLTLSGITNASGTWFVDAVASGGSTEVFLSTAVCFAAGTRVLTATGERVVESLLQSDIVLTLADGELSARAVKWVGRRRIDLTAHPRPETVAPIRIRRGAFADNMPHTDLLVSPDHAIFVDGKLICARQLVNGTTIRQEQDWTSVDYYHVELDAHAILLAEGLPAESYLDTGNRGFFGNSDAPLTLHPDLTDESDYPEREVGSCAPFVSDEADVRPVWQRLADRAAALGQPVPQVETTTDPAPCLIAKGRTVKPMYGDNGLYIFALPKGATEVRLVSRSAAPTDVRPWLEDRRRLGLYVERIVLRDADDVREVPVDHPGLSQGWWAVELGDARLARWTDGNAMLPLPEMAGPTMLEVRAGSVGLLYPVQPEREVRAA